MGCYRGPGLFGLVWLCTKRVVGKRITIAISHAHQQQHQQQQQQHQPKAKNTKCVEQIMEILRWNSWWKKRGKVGLSIHQKWKLIKFAFKSLSKRTTPISRTSMRRPGMRKGSKNIICFVLSAFFSLLRPFSPILILSSYFFVWSDHYTLTLWPFRTMSMPSYKAFRAMNGYVWKPAWLVVQFKMVQTHKTSIGLQSNADIPKKTNTFDFGRIYNCMSKPNRREFDVCSTLLLSPLSA